MVKQRLQRKSLTITGVITATILAITAVGMALNSTLFSLPNRIQSTLREVITDYKELTSDKMISSHEESSFVDYQYNATFQLDSNSIKSFFEDNPMAGCSSHNLKCSKTIQDDVVIWTYLNENDNISATLTANRQKQQIYWTYASY